jgi:hypothetical protein
MANKMNQRERVRVMAKALDVSDEAQDAAQRLEGLGDKDYLAHILFVQEKIHAGLTANVNSLKLKLATDLPAPVAALPTKVATTKPDKAKTRAAISEYLSEFMGLDEVDG